MPSPTTTLVIPTYRRLDILSRCIAAVRAMTVLPDQILVVCRPADDPDTYAWLKAHQIGTPPLQLLTVDTPGQIHALNTALDHVACDITAIIDDDALPTTDWLEKILPHYQDPLVGAVGGRDRVHRPDGRLLEIHPPPQIAGVYDGWGNMIGNHDTIEGLPRYVEGLKGCNWSFRTTARGSLRFDERLRGRGAQVANETLFCLGLRQHGWNIILDPSVLVNHFPAEKPDQRRNEWPAHVCRDTTYNNFVTMLAFQPGFMKWRNLLFTLIIGHRHCPGIFFILHSLLKRPRSLPGQLWGGWSGYALGWRTYKKFRTLPGTPRHPDEASHLKNCAKNEKK